jgi:hypothetical protein
MSGMHYSLSLATGAFTGPLRGAMSALGGLTGSLSKIGNIATGLSSMRGALDTLVSPFTKPVTLAADMEALETSFRALLRSGPAAKSMVADLMQFADSTPFNPEPVAQAGKQLLAFGFAANSIKPLLSDIGDLAAGMGKPIDEVADAFGRLKSGQFGEAFEAMRRFGISRKDMEEQGLEFDKGGSFRGSTEQALEGIRAIIRTKFGGGMQELSRTFSGITSTLQGYWAAFQRALGEPIATALKPVLLEGIELLKQYEPQARKIGETLGSGISTAFEILKGGNALGFVTEVAELAGKLYLNQMGSAILTMGQMATTVLGGAFSSAVRLLSDESFWEGIRGTVDSILDTVAAALLRMTADLVEKLPIGMRLGADVTGMREQADVRTKDAGMARFYAKENFDAINLDRVMQPMGESIAEAGDIWKKGSADGVANLKQFFADLAALGEKHRPAPYSRTDYANMTEAAEAARSTLPAIEQARWMRTREDDTGISNSFQATLNPDLINRIMNPGRQEDPNRLSEAIASRVLGSSIIESMARNLDIIARPQPGDLAAQF